MSTGTGNLTVTLGDTPPRLSWYMFDLVPAPGKTVTVKVPNNAAWSGIISGSPYYEPSGPFTENWGNGFRGGGWNGSAMEDNTGPNGNITLIVQALP
jgi:hypothetical protein